MAVGYPPALEMSRNTNTVLNKEYLLSTFNRKIGIYNWINPPMVIIQNKVILVLESYHNTQKRNVFLSQQPPLSVHPILSNNLIVIPHNIQSQSITINLDGTL